MTTTYRDYPYEGKRLKINGIEMHYLDEGDRDGQSLVMVHGNPSWSYYYRKVVEGLKSQYRCVVPDHIGMGLSGRPGDGEYEYTIRRRIDDLETLLDELGIVKDITLVVHDWGGMIGMGYAVRHPERIKRIVVTNTAAFGLPERKKMPWQLIACRTPGVGPLLVRGFNGFCKYAVKHCVKRITMDAGLKQAYLGPYDSWKNRLGVLRFVEDIPLHKGHCSYETVAEIDGKIGQFGELPMLICWGLKDFVFDVHFLDEWVRRFPGAAVHRFEDAGHYVLEDAGDEIVGLIQGFLDEHPIG